MIEFTIEGAPIPKGRPKFRIMKMGGKSVVNTYTPSETRAAERALRLASLKWKPTKPLTGALGVTTVFVVSAPRLAADRSKVWPHVKPDDDNMRKLVLDSLNGIFWIDDGQICAGESFKIYGARPRTFVRIWQLGREDLARVRAMLGEPVPQLDIFGGANG